MGTVDSDHRPHAYQNTPNKYAQVKLDKNYIQERVRSNSRQQQAVFTTIHLVIKEMAGEIRPTDMEKLIHLSIS